MNALYSNLPLETSLAASAVLRFGRVPARSTFEYGEISVKKSTCMSVRLLGM